MNIFRDVPVYKFNSNIFFSPDNDLKRPLATVILCTHTESVKFCVYIPPKETGRTFYNIIQLSTNLWKKKVMWWTIVTSKNKRYRKTEK